MYIVYAHTNKINGKKYIGQTNQSPEKRWRKDGVGYYSYTSKKQSKFWNAIQKYGWDNFTHEILEENLSEEEANIKEEYYITLYDSIENGYNIQKGGNNYQITDETKRKISETKKSQNRHMSEEMKKKLSILYSGENNPFFGRKHTEETKEKMRKNHKNFSGGNSPHAKKVICLETGQIFPSATEAAEFCHRSRSAINNCVSGRTNSAGSYHWKRYEEEEESLNEV